MQTACSVRRLIRRFFTEQLEFINVAKNYIDVARLLRPRAADRLPGRQPRQARRQERRPVPGLPASSTRSAEHADEIIGTVKMPKTWYITSDGLIAFLDLQQPRGRHRAEVQGDRVRSARNTRTSSRSSRTRTFPPEIVKGLVGRPRRLRRRAAHRPQLQPARGPAGHGLLRQVQEPVPGQPGRQAASGSTPCSTPWPRSTPRSSAPTPSSTAPSGACSTSTRRWAIMIQEVVGTQVGKYFFPAFAGVAFSQQRVPLVAADQARGRPAAARARPGHPRRRPGQRRLPRPARPGPARACASTSRPRRPSAIRPSSIDVINLEREPLRHQGHRRPARARYGARVPDALTKVFSVYDDDRILQRPMGFDHGRRQGQPRRHLRGPRRRHAVHARRCEAHPARRCARRSAARWTSSSPTTARTSTSCSAGPQSQAARRGGQRRSRADVADRRASSSRPTASSPTAASPDITHVVYVDPERYGELADCDDLRRRRPGRRPAQQAPAASASSS
ncbi:MAG: hypothetical protein MZV64_12980 [Ignavibacteriales bacterium]|nr:hypothetical protein [Ignavibacteriales bacterium]